MANDKPVGKVDELGAQLSKILDTRLAERQENRDALAEKALLLAQDAEDLGYLTDMLGADRVIALAQVYATLAARP